MFVAGAVHINFKFFFVGVLEQTVKKLRGNMKTEVRRNITDTNFSPGFGDFLRYLRQVMGIRDDILKQRIVNLGQIEQIFGSVVKKVRKIQDIAKIPRFILNRFGMFQTILQSVNIVDKLPD